MKSLWRDELEEKKLFNLMAESRINKFLSSSIGMKFLMAVTGIILFGFVVLHLLGNLQIFGGPVRINSYAKLLKSIQGPLWTARSGFIAAVLIHIAAAIKLTKINMESRPVRYAVERTVQASWASLHMFDTGMLVLLFVLFHLAHFTVGVVQPEFAHLTDPAGNPDVYTMVVHGFQNVWYSIFYILAMCGVGVHLSHGIYSFFQTLGLSHSWLTPLIKLAAPIIGWSLAIGYIAIPVAVLSGLIN